MAILHPHSDSPPAPTDLEAGEGESGSRPRISRRRLLLLAAGGVLGVAGGVRLLGGLGGFRINTVESPTPTFDPTTYRLTVDGAVGTPISLSFDELLALPSATQVSDFHCVEGWGVKGLRWQGVRLQTLIDRVQPIDPAFITFHSLDGVYRDSLTLQQAALPDVLIAYQMNEKPLAPEHGRPLRLVMPQMYGYKGPKWLTRIEFSGQREVGYWERRGWKLDAWLA